MLQVQEKCRQDQAALRMGMTLQLAGTTTLPNEPFSKLAEHGLWDLAHHGSYLSSRAAAVEAAPGMHLFIVCTM